MKIPNGSQAVIRPEKLRDYLLNIEHKRGKSKMGFPLFEDVILLEDLPEEGLLAGDIGVVVERHDVPDMDGNRL